MFDRLNLLVLFRDHWASLQERGSGQVAKPDRAVRGVLLAGPVLAAVAVGWAGVELKSPGALVSALSLFSAGLLAAFAQLANIRSRYVTPETDYDPERPTRLMLDEAVAHILTAAMLSVSAAVVIIVGMNAADGPRLGACFSAAVAAMGTYLFLIFTMTIRKLYAAYVVANDVREDKLFRR